MLEPVAKASAIAFGLLYGIGFLVLSIHHASFGISEFGLFRPRIMATGFLFSALAMLPLIVAHRSYSLLQRKREISEGPEPFLKIIDRLGVFANSCIALTMGTGMLFPLPPNTFNHSMLILFYSLLVGLCASIFYSFTPLIGHRFQKTSVLFSVLGLVADIVGLVWTKNASLQLVAGWFFVVGMIAVGISRWRQKTDFPFKIPWESAFMGMVATISLYTLVLYPRLKPEFGGGGTRPAVLYFSNSLSRHCFILDENDQGFYVLFDANSRHATFFPRSGVTAVFFGEDENKVKSELPLK